MSNQAKAESLAPVIDATPEDIAKAAIGRRFFADIKAINKVGKALDYDQSKIYVQWDGEKVHIAEKVASENLRNASDEAILKAIKAQLKVQEDQELRRMDRVGRGRTPGAGAGGYNRDVANVEHRIDDAKTKIGILNGELTRRKKD